jgi:hypothetical protein
VSGAALESRRTNVRVECYAGYRGEETPRRFRLAGGWLEVEKVVDRWREPDHRYFKVHAADSNAYVLRQYTESERWDLVSVGTRASERGGNR